MISHNLWKNWCDKMERGNFDAYFDLVEQREIIVDTISYYSLWMPWRKQRRSFSTISGISLDALIF